MFHGRRSSAHCPRLKLWLRFARAWRITILAAKGQAPMRLPALFVICNAAVCSRCRLPAVSSLMPKLVFTSDWHAGLTSIDVIGRILQEIAAAEPDALIVAGDQGGTLREARSAIALARAILPCPIGVIAGNHDLWGRAPGGGDSLALFEHTWPALCRELGLVWLETEVLRVGATAITGTIGWYDYSRRPPDGHPLLRDWTPAKLAAVKSAYNNDAHYITWSLADPEFADQCGEALERRLATLDADVSVEAVVVATHVPAFAEQLVSRPEDSPIADAYFGNLTLGRRVARYSKVSHVVSGHTHRGVAWTEIQHETRVIQAATVASDYGVPAFLQLHDLIQRPAAGRRRS